MQEPRPAMSGEQMRQYLTEVGAHLAARRLTGEIVLAGGAVMVMALNARGGSRDIDAVFVKEATAIVEAARDVARAHGLPVVWLNDHVRMFVAPDAPTVDFFDVPGLRVRMVRLDYLFYMKAWAGDPIPLLLEVTNSGKNVIVLDDDFNYTFVIAITNKEGTSMAKTLYGDKWLGKRAGASRRRVMLIELAPNKKASVTVDVGLLFDLTEAGNYLATVECQYVLPKTNAKTINDAIKIEKLAFKINAPTVPKIKQP